MYYAWECGCDVCFVIAWISMNRGICTDASEG